MPSARERPHAHITPHVVGKPSDAAGSEIVVASAPAAVDRHTLTVTVGIVGSSDLAPVPIERRKGTEGPPAPSKS